MLLPTPIMLCSLAGVRTAKPPQSKLQRLKYYVWGAFFSSSLFGLLLFCNLLQMFTVVVYPFSRRFFRRLNCAIAGFWWSSAVTVAEDIYGIRFSRSGDPVPEGENAVVISNHQQMPDVIGLLWLGKKARMVGNMKWMAKDVLKYVPGMGWGLSFLDSVFLKRHWEKDQAQIHKTFSKYKRENIPIWFVFFPEGTRITASKLQRSNGYAAKAKIKTTECVLIPRTKGFVASVSQLRSHVQAVYDVSIFYPNGIATLSQLFLGYVKELHICVRRFPVAQIPLDDKLAQWLVDRYYEKDQWLLTMESAATSPAS